jgi:chitosanase
MNAEGKIKATVRVFETGTIADGYDTVSIYADGTHPTTGADIEQITYGALQTTEQSDLVYLLTEYCKHPDSLYRSVLFNYIAKVGKLNADGTRTILSTDTTFVYLLKEAAQNDPRMRIVQDSVFDEKKYQPALRWAKRYGFSYPLSILVIFDSFIHSGSIFPFLRRRFTERTPAFGGSEQAWIKAYVGTRRRWLATHKRTILHKTVYRMDCFQKLIDKNDWLLVGDINANGITIK